MATLTENTATMDSSYGITLKTKGKYIPHDIIVKPNSTFSIKDKITMLNLESNVTQIKGNIEITSLNVSSVGMLIAPSISNISGNTSVSMVGGTLSVGSLPLGSNVTVNDAKGTVTINPTKTEQPETTRVFIGETQVSNNNGLIKVDPVFKGGETSAQVTGIENIILSNQQQQNGGLLVPLICNLSIKSEDVKYLAKSTGWLDKAVDTVSFATHTNTYTAPTIYLSQLTIPSANKISQITNNGVIDTFSNINSIGLFGNAGTITTYDNNGETSIDTFNGTTTIKNLAGKIIITENGPSLGYDSATKAVVFTY